MHIHNSSLLLSTSCHHDVVPCLCLAKETTIEHHCHMQRLGKKLVLGLEADQASQGVECLLINEAILERILCRLFFKLASVADCFELASVVSLAARLAGTERLRTSKPSAAAPETCVVLSASSVQLCVFPCGCAAFCIVTFLFGLILFDDRF